MNIKKKVNSNGVFSLFLVAFLYGFFGILSRLIGIEQIPIYYQSGLRALFAALLLAFFVYTQHTWKKVEKQDILLISIRGVFSVVSVIAFFMAVNYLSISTVYFIVYAGSTLGGYILGKLLFNEGLTVITGTSLLLSLLGLYLIYSFSIDIGKAFFAAIALISGVSTIVWDILAKKIPSTYSPLQLSFLDNVIGGSFSLLISLVIREKWTLPVLSTPWMLNIIFACMFVVTGQLIVSGFRRVHAQSGTLIMLTEVLFGVLFAAIFFHETVTPIMLLGGGLILIAVVIPNSNIFSLRIFLKAVHIKNIENKQ